MNSKDLSDHSLDPVPADRAAELPVDTYSQTAAGRLVGHAHQGESLAPQPFSPSVNLPEFI